jgi:hypothetical protein
MQHLRLIFDWESLVEAVSNETPMVHLTLLVTLRRYP